jgi:hypothetical protein
VRSIILVMTFLCWTELGAQEDELTPVPEPPPLPEKVESGEVLEPDITIVQRKEEVVYEYRVNGRLRAVKVVPRNEAFPPYYLIDTDGDGRLERRRWDLGTEVFVNGWVLFSW